MAIQFTWDILRLLRDSKTGIVYQVDYSIRAFDGVNQAMAHYSVSLDSPSLADMIPYQDLDKNTCIEWVKDKLGVEKVSELQGLVLTDLDERRAPKVAAGVPWSN